MNIDELYKKVQEIISNSKKEHIAFLQKMISYDTTIVNEGVTGNEGNAQGFIADILKKLGCKVDIFEPDIEKIKKYPDFTPGHDYKGRPNVAGVLKGSGGGRSLLIDCHIDIVPIGNRNLWKHDPLGGAIEDGKLFGRGAVDMKAGHAGTIMAIDCIRKAGIKLKGDLIFLSVVDEERGEGNGCLSYLDRGYRADGALFPEGTDMKKIVFGSQGLLLGKVRVRGKSVHPTIKWKGVSAIEKMIKIINGLESLEKDWILTKREPELGPPMISIGRIQGGAEVNSIPEECEIYVSIVYLPMQADEKGRGTLVKKEVENYISTLCKGDSWLAQYPAEVTWLNEITPSVIDRNHDLVVNLKKIAEKYLGDQVTVDWGELPSMSRIMNDMANMPMIQFGPGAIEQAHIIDEWVSVDQYLSYIKIVSEFILDWCGVEL